MSTTCENAPESKEYLDFVEKFNQNARSKSLED